MNTNWGVSKKGRWAFIPALDAHPGKRRLEEKDGNQRRAEPREEQQAVAWASTITHDKDVWVSGG